MLWHSARVFIGNWGTARPYQGQLGPQLPSLSPEYSLTGVLQRVITTHFITDVAQPAQLTWRPADGALQHGPDYTRAPSCIEWDKALWSSVIRSLKSLMVFASACRSEEGAWAFAWTTSAARPAEPAAATFSLWNVDVENLERGGGVFAFAPTLLYTLSMALNFSFFHKRKFE
jgi:hypothetical protein